MSKRMAARLKDLRQKLWQRSRHATGAIAEWLASVVRGCFPYHAVPGNQQRLRAFRKDVPRLPLATLRRRSQRSR